MVAPLSQVFSPSDPVQAGFACVGRVAILLCTYNGERFLAQQLESIATQTYPHWVVVVSDDGSIDSTLEIVREYAERWGGGKLLVRQGPGRGYAANFLDVTRDGSVKSEFYAWADQDDIWQENKLESALQRLTEVSQLTPALYCGRTQLINEHGARIGFSPLLQRSVGFANALVQSVAGGNTMVFNDAARQLFQRAGADLDIVSHDWWAYLLVSGVGGQVFYDVCPTILYRQHDTNLIGSTSGVSKQLKRVRMLFRGRFRGWNEKNIAALDSIQCLLTEENRTTLDLFKRARSSRGLARLNWLRRSGVYRQSSWGNLGLVLAAMFNGI
ncbi:glycosyltransferase family 2 protein [Pseudomonas fluorescens]|uniref:glycosyltransferase family 2 protein n=1 Tax=Pseudomonas fluorescens TaxID=294 RepID=UPI003747B226